MTVWLLKEKNNKSLDESSDIQLTEMTPSALFLPPDVILEVEGIKLYVRKEDSYPVFKRMLETDFKEKTSDRDTTAWGKVQRI